jgi:capsular polysaccharide biosynthesis protein
MLGMLPSWLDWRRGLTLLAHNWPLIVVGMLLGAGVAAGYRLFGAPNVYEAEALVLVARPRYQVELESKIKSNQEPLSGASTNIASLRARLDTLAVLARSTEVERAAQERLGAVLSADEQRPGGLVGRVRVRPANELLRISASANDPVLAANLANTWADQVATRVERVYSSSSGVKAMEAEVQHAHQAHVEADRALSRFAMEHPFDALTRRVQAKTQEVELLEALQEQRTGYVRSRALNLHRSITEIDQLIRDAETLGSQVAQPTLSQAAGLGDGLALMLIRARMYLPASSMPQAFDPQQASAQSSQAGDARAGSARPADVRQPSSQASSSPSTTLQVMPPTGNVGSDRSDDRRSDLVAMIGGLRERRDELLAEFQTLAARLQTGQDPASILALPADDPTEVALRQAQAELHQAQAELTELTRQRDELAKQRSLMATSYETLLNKTQELRVLRATDDSGGVTVAERAVPARGPSGPGPLRFAMVGGLLGLLLACALVLSPLVRDGLRELLGSQAPHTPRADEERAAGVALS